MSCTGVGFGSMWLGYRAKVIWLWVGSVESFWTHPLELLVVSIGHFHAFHVPFFPLEYAPYSEHTPVELKRHKSRKMTNGDYSIGARVIDNQGFMHAPHVCVLKTRSYTQYVVCLDLNNITNYNLTRKRKMINLFSPAKVWTWNSRSWSRWSTYGPPDFNQIDTNFKLMKIKKSHNFCFRRQFGL